MTEVKGPLLKTGQAQISVTNKLVEKLKPSLEYLIYNVKRYKVPVTLVLFYSEEDLSEQLKESKRLTDVVDTIKIGDSYFNFVFLIFAEEVDSYSFVKHVESTKLSNIEHKYYYEKLQPTVHNYFNFINNYIFEILSQD